MKIIVEENIIEEDYCQVEKSFYIRNDDNVTLIVKLAASDIEITFLNNTIELLPFEKKIINVSIIVKEGIETGKIFVKAYNKTDYDSNLGINIQTSMVITVVTKGLIDIVDESEKSSNYTYFYTYIFIAIIFIIIIFILYIKYIKRRSKNN